MRKRTVVRIISFSLAVALAATGITIKIHLKAEDFFLEIERGYSRSLDDFSTGINNISVTLQKAQYVTTPAQLSSMAARLLSEAEISKSALAQLPAGDNLTAVNKFLSQVGNCAVAVSKNLILNGDSTKTDRQNIASLSTAASKIANIVNDTQITYNNAEYWAKELEGKIEDAVDEDSLSSALGELEGELTDYPTLVYDGPYSDHIFEKEPEMLKNEKEVSKAEASEVAARIADLDINSLQSDGSVKGNMPAYRFAGEGITASVSIKGGFPIYMRKERVINESLLSYEQALEKAKRYLKRIELSGFTETYYSINEGICIINMAYLDGETICYTDLIKIGVAMDNGEIMLFEGSGYISNHKSRAFETAVYTLKEAQKVVSKELTVTQTALALIPTNSVGEVRCYEFTCTAKNGEEILVYINTQTKAEEDVLILLKSDGGILTK